VIVALRLAPAEEPPTLHQLAAALDRPERPLFIGRKPFLPSGPINAGIAEAETIAEALGAGLIGQAGGVRGQWPPGEGPAGHGPLAELADERDWSTGVHAGVRRVVDGKITCPPGAVACPAGAVE
jgi:CRISPR system Cascade subunit CasD